MNTIWRRSAYSILRHRFMQCEIKAKPFHSAIANVYVQNVNKPAPCCTPKNPLVFTRYKSKKSSKRDIDSDDEDNVIDEDSSLSKDSKVLKFNTTSLRTDVILKSALGVSRNKIEQVFYESKIRVNGKKIMKKSHTVQIGSEIDVIKSFSPHNPDHLYVARVEVLNLVAKEDNIVATVRRFKNLLIENYETDPYKGSTEDNE